MGPEPALVSITVINARDHAQIPGLPRCSGIWGILVPALVNPFIPAGQPESHFQQEFGSCSPGGWEHGRAGRGTPRAAGVPLLSAEALSMLTSQLSPLSAKDFSMLRSRVLLWESYCWDMGRAGGERFVMDQSIFLLPRVPINPGNIQEATTRTSLFLTPSNSQIFPANSFLGKASLNTALFFILSFASYFVPTDHSWLLPNPGGWRISGGIRKAGMKAMLYNPCRISPGRAELSTTLLKAPSRHLHSYPACAHGFPNARFIGSAPGGNAQDPQTPSPTDVPITAH